MKMPIAVRAIHSGKLLNSLPGRLNDIRGLTGALGVAEEIQAEDRILGSRMRSTMLVVNSFFLGRTWRRSLPYRAE